MVALYRPGPMDYIPSFMRRMHGEEPMTYHHPDLEPILRETFGIMVYQEQIIQIATTPGRLLAGEADQIRKAVGKKKRKRSPATASSSSLAVCENGYTPAVAEAVYGDIEFFANYGFNKAHAADYAMITCQTAYLKAHYPVEYMTALLSVSRNDTAKVALYAVDARRMGIPVLPPDVNRSGLDFTIEEHAAGQADRGAAGQLQAKPAQAAAEPAATVNAIRFGLVAVKNVGAGPVQAILEARETGGPFKSLGDFCPAGGPAQRGQARPGMPDQGRRA